MAKLDAGSSGEPSDVAREDPRDDDCNSDGRLLYAGDAERRSADMVGSKERRRLNCNWTFQCPGATLRLIQSIESRKRRPCTLHWNRAVSV